MATSSSTDIASKVKEIAHDVEDMNQKVNELLGEVGKAHLESNVYKFLISLRLCFKGDEACGGQSSVDGKRCSKYERCCRSGL